MSAEALLLANLSATLFLTGLAWYLQVVQLPLFQRVGRDQFTDFAREQRRRNTLLMALPMLVELVTTVWLGLVLPRGVLRTRWLVTAVPLLIVWAVTLNFYMSRFRAIVRGFSETDLKWLLRYNSLRTLSWSVRAGLLLWIATGGLHIQELNA